MKSDEIYQQYNKDKKEMSYIVQKLEQKSAFPIIFLIFYSQSRILNYIIKNF